MSPMKIYMADVSHDTILLVTDTFPINIGLVGSYARKIHGDDVEITLFKYAESVIDALHSEPPDVLALSNYCWNSQLSERLAQIGKQVNPNIITVQGGTNFPNESDQCRDFLLSRPNTDFYVELEGEISFSNVITRILNAPDGGVGLFDEAVEGCLFIDPSTRHTNQPVLIRGALPSRITDLEEIPSPYLNGMLDQFFDGRLSPMLETNRGCPFKCSFCHTGNDYFQKTNTFSMDRVRDEINYIAPRAGALGITKLHITDVNFGMYPRDRETCLLLHQSREEHGWPLQIGTATGKNNKERVIDATRILGDALTVTMSVQSMDQSVLANIKRTNIKLDHYTEINQFLAEQRRPTKGEVIMGLPGETKETFMRGVDHMLESGVSAILIYTLMLLEGTEFRNPDYLNKYGIKGKFRIVPMDFGEYQGERVFDYEEAGVENDDMSFDDYVYLRGFALILETLHNGHPFEELFHYVSAFGVKRMELLRRAYEDIDQAPSDVREILRDFLAETKSELWDSPEELVAHYQKDENYDRLLRGEAGNNLMQKYCSIGLAFAAEPWVDYLTNVCKTILAEKMPPDEIDETVKEMDILAQFCRNKLTGLLKVDGNVDPVYMESPYDIVGWVRSPAGTPLGEYSTTVPVNYEFHYTDDQLKVRKDLFRCYGTDTSAISKIVGRATSLEQMIRGVRIANLQQQNTR